MQPPLTLEWALTGLHTTQPSLSGGKEVPLVVLQGIIHHGQLLVFGVLVGFSLFLGGALVLFRFSLFRTEAKSEKSWGLALC